jgi:urea transport system permease protein
MVFLQQVINGLANGMGYVLIAMGLTLVFGVLRIVNFAHGEFYMLGAYATYLVQNLFRSVLPGAFDAYILVAIPASFLAAAAVGAVLERIKARATTQQVDAAQQAAFAAMSAK